MDNQFITDLRKLSLKDLFEINYKMYEHLRDNDFSESGSSQLMRKIMQGDYSHSISKCMRKMKEEQEEAREAVRGKHVHEGQTKRETVINEIQQSIYWPTLIAVAQRVTYPQIDYSGSMMKGFRWTPVIKEELEGRTKIVTVLNGVAYDGGWLLNEYNMDNPSSIISPSDIPLHDLKQMHEKAYLRQFLEGKLDERIRNRGA